MAIHTSLALEFFVKNWNNFERNKFLLSENGSLNSKSARYNPQKKNFEQRYCDTPQKKHGIYHIAKSKEIYEHVGFVVECVS